MVEFPSAQHSSARLSETTGPIRMSPVPTPFDVCSTDLGCLVREQHRLRGRDRRAQDAGRRGPGLAQALIVREVCETRSNIDRSGLVTDVHVHTPAERRAPLCSSLILRPLESMPVSVI